MTRAIELSQLGSALGVDESTGNVGIGTTSPSEALHVRSTSATQLVIERDGVTDQIASVIFKDGSGDQNRVLSTDSNLVVGYGGSNTEAVRIKSTGTVAFNNPTHDSPAQIQTDAKDTTAYAPPAAYPANQIEIQNSVSMGSAIIRFRSQSNNGSAGIWNVGAVPRTSSLLSDFIFQSRTADSTYSEIARISGNGNVGIGTNDPADKFTVYGAPASVWNSSTNNRVWSAGTTNGHGLMKVFRSDETVFARFDSDAKRAGFGTDSPTDVLTVYNSNVGNPTGITIRNTEASSAYSHARLRLESQNATAYADIYADVANSALRLGYNSSSTLNIKSTGNVGIGTNDPGSFKLSVRNGGLHVTGNSNTDYDYIGGIQVGNGVEAPTLATFDNNQTTNYKRLTLAAIHAGDVHLRSFWGISVDINDGQLNDSTSASQTRIPSTSSFTVNRRSGNGAFSTLLAVRNSGNVGIGTNNPTSKLDVVGKIQGSLHMRSQIIDKGIVSSGTVENRTLSDGRNYIRLNHTAEAESTRTYTCNFNSGIPTEIGTILYLEIYSYRKNTTTTNVSAGHQTRIQFGGVTMLDTGYHVLTQGIPYYKRTLKRTIILTEEGWKDLYADNVRVDTQDSELIIERPERLGAHTTSDAIAKVETARFNNSGNLAFALGNGIDFSATSDSGGMTSELLDDYEEGTWTPTIKENGTGAAWNTITAQEGHYTKIGRKVFVTARIVYSGVPTNVNTSFYGWLAGFPVVAKTSVEHGAFSMYVYLAGGTNIPYFIRMPGGGTVGHPYSNQDSTTPGPMRTSEWPSVATTVYFQGFYFT